MPWNGPLGGATGVACWKGRCDCCNVCQSAPTYGAFWASPIPPSQNSSGALIHRLDAANAFWCLRFGALCASLCISFHPLSHQRMRYTVPVNEIL